MRRLLLDGQAHDGIVPVPESVAKCPECGGRLYAEVEAWDEQTGQPIEGVYPDCELGDDPDDDPEFTHRFRQSDWQAVRDRVDAWAAKHVRVEVGP